MFVLTVSEYDFDVRVFFKPVREFDLLKMNL